MEKFVERIIGLRWLIIAIVVGLTLFFGFQIRYLTINSDILSTLPDNDPPAKLYQEIGEQFGGNDIGMVVLETGNIYEKEVLEHVRDITDSLRIIPGVSTVTSLTNVLNITSSEWGIEIGKLVDEYELPESQQELDSLRAYVNARDIYKGALVSEDGSATIILATILPDVDVQDVALEIKAKVEEMDLPETVYFGGLPFMLNDITDLILMDMIWLIPIVFVIIASVLLLGFRSVHGMILPLLISGITVVWTLGIMAFIGFELTIISNIVPVVLLAIGSAYTIHVLNSNNHNLLKDRKAALVRAMGYTTIPVIMAAVTTAIGFVSFIFGAYLTMIKEFGIITAIGILVALFLSIVFVPALISAFAINTRKPGEKIDDKKNLLAKFMLDPLTQVLFHFPKTILVAWVIILTLSLGCIFLIRTNVNIADYFEKDNPTRISEDVLQQKFGGSLPTFVLFEGNMQDPELLKTMIKTEEFMKKDPNVSTATSVADLVEQLNDAMGEGKKIPDERAKIEQLWFLLDGQDVMPQLVSDELDRGIVQSKFASIETDEIEAFTKKMELYAEENTCKDFKISFTGTPSLYVRLNDSLIKSQYSSLIIALFMVLLIVAILLRSFTKGINATVPIIAAILVLLGFMGITAIPLDIATVLVGSIALGIGIDYSIHVISGFNNHLKESGDVEQAIGKTLLTTGKAVIINVLSVAAGFLVLLLAQIVPIQNFGMLIAISMFGSGLGALTLLPAILILANRRKNNKQNG